MSATGIYGLSGSGIDVDSMVKVGMLNKQSQYDRMYKKEVRQEWTKEAYANLYSDMSTYSNTTMSKYKMSSTLNPQTVSSTNESVVKATAHADAAPMTHTVKVEKTASNAYLLTGGEGIKRIDADQDGSIYLKDLIRPEDLTDQGDGVESISFTISDGKDSGVVTFTKKQIFDDNETLNDLAAAIRNAGVNIQASYDSANDTFSLYNKSGGSANGIYLTAGTFDDKGKYTHEAGAENLLKSLNLHKVTTDSEGGSELSEEAIAFVGANAYGTSENTVGDTTTTEVTTYENGKTFKTTTVKLNSSWTDVSFDEGANEGAGEYTAKAGDKDVVITPDNNGKVDIKIGDWNATGTYEKKEDGSLVLSYKDENNKDVSVALSNSSATVTTTDSVAKEEVALGGMSGSNAEVTIDGRSYSSDTNKITVANVTYSLASKGSSTLTVTQDTEKVVENVLKFVDDYNEMLEKLNKLYHEENYRDYDVLTESQKKAMTQEQIEKWEEKAKSGLLYHNQTLGKIISNMREALYTPVESVDSKYKTAMSIGIESRTDRGILRVDENKLRKAIADDPDVVYQLFGSLDTANDEFSKNGIAQRLGDVANSAMKEIKTYAGTSTETADGSSLGKLIEEMKKKMSDFKTMMNAYENMLYKKYDAMETAIQRLGVSLGYITGGQ